MLTTVIARSPESPSKERGMYQRRPRIQATNLLEPDKDVTAMMELQGLGVGL